VNAPWEPMVAQGCGLWTEATTDALVSAITRLDASPAEDLAAMGAKGRDWMTSDFSTSGLTQKFQELYRAVSGDKQRDPIS